MKRNSNGIGFAAAIVATVAVSLLAMLALLNRRDQRLGLNEEIQYDDFAFSVLSVRQAGALGTGDAASSAHGNYYIISMKVANHAKRVDYLFKRSSPILVDDQGMQYVVSPDGQAALDASLDPGQLCAAPIPAGASCVTEIVFDLPRDTRVSHLKMSFGGNLGDLLDTIFWGNKSIDLGSIAIQPETTKQTSEQRGRLDGYQPE